MGTAATRTRIGEAFMTSTTVSCAFWAIDRQRDGVLRNGEPMLDAMGCSAVDEVK
jgi:hypothetical protein